VGAAERIWLLQQRGPLSVTQAPHAPTDALPR